MALKLEAEEHAGDTRRKPGEKEDEGHEIARHKMKKLQAEYAELSQVGTGPDVIFIRLFRVTRVVRIIRILGVLGVFY